MSLSRKRESNVISACNAANCNKMCELGSRRKCKCARGNQDIVIHPARLCNGCYSAGACCTTCSNDQGSDSEDLFHKANEKNTGKNKKQKKAERDEEARKKADEEARKNAERDEASKKADEEARKNAEDTRKKMLSVAHQ